VAMQEYAHFSAFVALANLRYINAFNNNNNNNNNNLAFVVFNPGDLYYLGY